MIAVPEAFKDLARETLPPVGAMMAGHSPAVQDATWEAITEAVRDATGGDGPMRLSNLSLLAVGRT